MARGQQLGKRRVEVPAQLGTGGGRRPGECTDHDERSGRQLAQSRAKEVTELALHSVPHHGTSHRPADDETHQGVLAVVRTGHVHHEGATGNSPPTPHRGHEVLAAGESSSRGQHRSSPARLRPTVRYGPGGGVRP